MSVPFDPCANLTPINSQFHPDDDNALSVLTYAVEDVNVHHIVLVGHTKCGGVAAAVDLDPSQAAPIRGPRLWWCGPLDVEGLALGSAQAAATGLSHLTGRTFSVDAERVAASFDSISHLRLNGRRPETAGALSGFHPTADGWVRLHGNYPHHARAIERALGASDPQRLREVLSSRRALEVEQRVRDAGGVAAAVRTPDAWARSSPGRAAAQGPWLRFQSSGIPVRRWAAPDDDGDDGARRDDEGTGIPTRIAYSMLHGAAYL